MRYLQTALYAEGPTDLRFLRPLILRVCNELCMTGQLTVEVADDVLDLQPSAKLRNLTRAKKIATAATESKSRWNVLFVHADADSDAGRALIERVSPAFKELEDLLGDRRQGVAVVPVRETESWALADGDALRKVFGVQLSNRELGVPDRPAEVERLLDPKRVLLGCLQSSKPPAGRLRQGVGPYLGSLGEEISLSVLEQVPSFGEFVNRLQDALTVLRVIGR